MRISILALGVAATLPVAAPGQASPRHERPSLLVLIAVDQMTPVYFDRYAVEFTGGLGRLYRNGVVFTDARQDHAITETAPGHSTLLSGRPPASTGIVSNHLGVPDRAWKLVGSTATGASPARFRGTTLYDWLVAADSGSSVLSFSTKDRGAILPVGRGGRDAYWFRGGRYTTSTWYRSELPPWLEAWNARQGALRLLGMEWNTRFGPERYPEPDSVPYEHGGRDFTFPHRLPTDTAAFLPELIHTPWTDSLTLDVALEGVRATGLGSRGHVDLLVVSLSGTDEVGHRYGPRSREVHDHLLRLDHWLGQFLDSLATTVPPARLVVALAADHGMTPYPEASGTGGRVNLAPLVKGLNEAYQGRYHTRFSFGMSSGLVHADLSALRSRGVDVDSLGAAIARQVEALPGVATVYTPADLTRRARSSNDARLWRRALPASFEWLVAASLRPGWIWATSSDDAEHGTTSVLDMHIPLIFLVPGVPAARVQRRVTSEDIGPTFAALAGVRPTEPVTGKPLREVLARP